MNYDNLKKLIFRYERAVKLISLEKCVSEEQMDMIRRFRNIWKSEDGNRSFYERFSEGIMACAYALDEKQYLPVRGAVLIAQKAPERVEAIFRELLLGDDQGDICLRQNRIERFIEDMEQLRMEFIPGNWKYKQDRRSTTGYMTFFEPEGNYLYRYKDAVQFAKFIEYEHKISSGGAYNLEAFYDMCDKVVMLMQRECMFLSEYIDTLSEGLSVQARWHLVVSNMLRFCTNHNLYEGEFEPSVERRTETFKKTVKDLECKESKECKDNSVSGFEALRIKLRELEAEFKKYSKKSLVGKKVTQKKYGEGQVISQQEKCVIVRFKNEEKSFIIDKKYDMRPYFEDDEAVMKDFEEYDKLKRSILDVRTELGEVW